MIQLRDGVAVFSSRAAVQMSSTVLWHGNDAALVDPGILPDEIDRIAAFLGDRRVGTIVLTHAHWDHIGGTGRWPGAEVVAHRTFSTWAAAVEAEEPLNASRAKAWAKAGLAAPAPIAAPMPTRLVDEGDRVGDTQVLHLPGHLGDAIGLLTDDLLICGDILDSVELPLPLQDVDAYLRSLDRIGELVAAGIDAVVPGHGPPLTRTEARAQVARDRAYLEEVIAVAEEAVARGWTFDEAWPRFAALGWFGKGDPARDGEHRLNAREILTMRMGVAR